MNWLVYIYAVVSGHVLEGSLGYYLNPLVNVLLGVFLLKEKLSPAQKAAVVLAASAGVAILAVGAGGAIWISLTLAASFAALRLPPQGGAGRSRSRGSRSRPCSWRRSPSAG